MQRLQSGDVKVRRRDPQVVCLRGPALEPRVQPLRLGKASRSAEKHRKLTVAIATRQDNYTAQDNSSNSRQCSDSSFQS